MDSLELVAKQQGAKIMYLETKVMCLEAELVTLRKALVSSGVIPTERRGVEMGLKIIEEGING